jgi:hypothetical protein
LRGFFTQVENEGLRDIETDIETALLKAWGTLQNRLLTL